MRHRSKPALGFADFKMCIGIAFRRGSIACRSAIASAILGLSIGTPRSVAAQSLTPDPGAWRPLSYSNLQHASTATATYIDIWKDEIDENNRAYIARGDRRYASANAPANEAHFVIWSTRKSVVLSILDTATGCVSHYADPSVHATVKLCPARIAQYQGATVHTSSGGKMCFLELQPSGAPADPTNSAAYAAYDIKTRTVKTGMIVNHKAVDGCSISIPLRPQ